VSRTPQVRQSANAVDLDRTQHAGDCSTSEVATQRSNVEFAVNGALQPANARYCRIESICDGRTRSEPELGRVQDYESPDLS
jgi:hypothetical protein